MLSHKNAFRRFQLSIFLHFIGRGLYSIFVPIILLQNGYSLTQTLLFLLLSAWVTIITSLWAVKALQKQRVILFNVIGVLAEITLLVLLTRPEYSLFAFAGILTFEALYFTFYYLAYYSIFNHFNDAQKTSANLGNTQIAIHLSSLVVPLIGALLLGKSTGWLVLVTAVFLLASLFPILQLSAMDINGERRQKIRLWTTRKEILEYAILSGIEIVIFTLWAIYAFRLGFSLVVISSIPIAEAVVKILITQNIKNRLQHVRQRETIKRLAFVSLILASLYRYFLPGHILVSNLLFGFLYMILHLTIETGLFQKLKGGQTYQASAFVSVVAFASRSIVILLTLVVGLKYALLLPIPLALGYFIFAPMFTKKRAV